MSAALGLQDLYHLQPFLEPLFREGLRDWPGELATTPAERLRAEFGQGEARRLIANLLWQTVRYRQQGLDPDYGIEHRGYWYVPVVATLARAGMLASEDVAEAMEDIPGVRLRLFTLFSLRWSAVWWEMMLCLPLQSWTFGIRARICGVSGRRVRRLC